MRNVPDHEPVVDTADEFDVSIGEAQMCLDLMYAHRQEVTDWDRNQIRNVFPLPAGVRIDPVKAAETSKCGVYDSNTQDSYSEKL